jgi:hypothetical protein
MPDDDSGHIPTSPGREECPDCLHHIHWKVACPTCGCPDGPTRKRLRDQDHVSGHAPSADRPVTGFA